MQEGRSFVAIRKLNKALSQNISAILIVPIRFYQRFVSPLFPPSCRYTPTCSEYAVQALKKYGPVKGLLLASARILRCNPWCKGGYDPLK